MKQAHAIRTVLRVQPVRLERGELALDRRAQSADLNHHDASYGTSTVGPAVPNTSDYITPGHTTSDARLGYTADMTGGGTVMVSLWCKNCGDKDYPAHVIGNGDPLAGYYGQAVARAWPRTFGINLNVKY